MNVTGFVLLTLTIKGEAMLTEQDRNDILEDAKRILKITEETGDPFNGDDWSLVQILRDYISLRNSEAGTAALVDIYERAYKAIGACDISNFLALCQEAGERREQEWKDSVNILNRCS